LMLIGLVTIRVLLLWSVKLPWPPLHLIYNMDTLSGIIVFRILVWSLPIVMNQERCQFLFTK
jgi:hypothetical protein